MEPELEQRLERYLQDTMSDEERIVFEDEMSTNPDLQKEVRLYSAMDAHYTKDASSLERPDTAYVKDLKAFLKTDRAASFKKQLEEAQKGYTKDERKSGFPWYKFSIAASITILMSLFVYNVFVTIPSSSDLYASYYSPKDLPSIIQRGGDISRLKDGIVAFQAGDYTQAIQILEAYQRTTENYELDSQLYLGVSYTHLKDYDKALQAFDTVLASNELGSIRGHWFKALLFLKMDQPDAALASLDKLLKTESGFKTVEAEELKEVLEEN